jgi:hypothetical protein
MFVLARGFGTAGMLPRRNVLAERLLRTISGPSDTVVNKAFTRNP